MEKTKIKIEEITPETKAKLIKVSEKVFDDMRILSLDEKVVFIQMLYDEMVRRGMRAKVY